MDKIIYMTSLYDCYKELLTDKQKYCFEDYYFNNLTLQEISENEKISRNAIFKQLKNIENKLLFYEEKLKIYEKTKKLEKIIKKIEDENIKKELENL